MKVSELIVLLQKEDPEAEVHYPVDSSFNRSVEINELERSTVTYGILTRDPITVNTVVVCTGWEGL